MRHSNALFSCICRNGGLLQSANFQPAGIMMNHGLSKETVAAIHGVLANHPNVEWAGILFTAGIGTILLIADAGILSIAAGFANGEVQRDAEVLGLSLGGGFDLHDDGVVLAFWEGSFGNEEIAFLLEF